MKQVIMRACRVGIVLVYALVSFANADAVQATSGSQEKSGALAEVFPSERVDEVFRSSISNNPEDGLPPGAQLAIVDSAGSSYIKGYGFAGSPQKNREKMDPYRHMIRIASQTKVFTAIGILQLYERGLIDIHDDVNQYLTDFQITNPLGGDPITFIHLLQHRSGLDDDWVGLATHSYTEHRPLAEVLKDRGIRFVHPAGELTSYTNRSYMLLGYLIEAVSGQAYEEYIQQNVLDVLDMRNTKFVLNDEDLANLAMGTRIVGDKFQEMWVTDTLTRPSGDLVSTAEDMSHFLTALLGNGSYAGRQLIEADTLQIMLNTCALMGPKLPGHCLGPATSVRDGSRYWYHNGGHPGYVSRFVIDRERGFAVFFGFLGDLNETLFHLDSFMEPFFPSSKPVYENDTVAWKDELTGTYRPTRGSMKTPEKLAFLYGGEVRVLVDGSNIIAAPYTFRQLEPLLFREQSSEIYAKAVQGDDSEINYIAFDNRGLTKLAWYETNRVQRAYIYFCFAGLVVALVIAIRCLLSPAINRSYLGRYSLFTISLASILWVTGLGIVFGYPMDFVDYQFGFSSLILTGFLIVKLAAISSIAAFIIGLIAMLTISISHKQRCAIAFCMINLLLPIPWAIYWQLVLAG